MRRVLLLGVLGACGFDHGALDVDAHPPDSLDAFVPTWALDSTSKKGVPASSADWNKVTAAAGLTLGPPSDLWLMQESSGTVADSIGSATLSPFGSPMPTYGITVTGWNRHALATPEFAGDIGFGSAATGNLDGTSYLLLVYVAVLAVPPTNRTIVGIGNQSDHHYVMITPSGTLAATYGPPSAGATPAVGVVPVSSDVRPIVLEIDGAGSHFVVYSDQDRLEPAWVATNSLGNLVTVGNAITNAGSINYLYGVMWKGSTAAQSDASVKKLLQTLGWTVTGY